MARDDEELRRLRGEHLRSSSQDKPLGHGENWNSLKAGVKKWVPDLLAFPADLLDAAAYAARKVGRGQSGRPVASLGAGEKVRGALERVAPRKQAEMTATPDTNYWEEGARMLNPLMAMNPKKALSPLSSVAAISGVPDISMAVVKPKGGNWFTGRGSELESSLEHLVRGLPQPTQLENWASSKLQKYIKNQLGTADDPIRALAEQGITHFPNPENLIQNGLHNWPRQASYRNREQAGLPQHDSATTPLGRAWDSLADAMIQPQPAEDLKRAYRGTDHPVNQWIGKLSDDQPVWDLSGYESFDHLGFPHLVDELHNATRADSDLPQHLRLSPEQLNQLGIEKAIRHVADINYYRANKAVEARKDQLTGPAVSTVMEFPENNPKGLRWVELKADEWKPPEGYEYDARTGTWRDPFSESTQPIRSPGVDRESLQKQLKYEGDMMGHCVGGYCDRVANGDARIFSLRDAKGEPHVTIEAQPGFSGLTDEEAGFLDDMGRLPRNDEELRNYLREYFPPEDLDSTNWIDNFKMTPKESLIPSWNLVQVKGKANKAPKDDYIPFIHQFIKNNPHPDFPGWGELYDLGNAQLYSPRHLREAERELLGNDLPKVFSLDDIKKLRESKSLPWEPLDDRPEFSRGGRVLPPPHHDNLEDFLRYRGD